MDEITTQSPLDSSIEIQEDTGGGLRKIFSRTGWAIAGVVLLTLFTLLKLPEDRLRAYIEGMISSQLSQQGITMTSSQSWISIGLGISYTMKDIVLTMPPPSEPIKIEKVTVSPYILPLLEHKAGAKIVVDNKGGKLTLSILQSLKQGSGEVSWSIKAQDLDIGGLGLLPALAGLHGSAIINGNGDVAGDMNVPSSLSGNIDFSLAKIVLDSQTLMGFAVPKLTISEGKLEVQVDKGKAHVKTLDLGKASNPNDDIRAKVTGDVVLGRNWQYSTLNLRADFSLSQNVIKSFVLIDALLSAGKKPDGSYSYTISGPLYSPTPTPAK
jgi:type II secretion system protein N